MTDGSALYRSNQRRTEVAPTWLGGRRFSWPTLGFLTLDPLHRLNLLYLGFWIIGPSYEGSATKWLMLVAALCVFMPFYTLLHMGMSRRATLTGGVGLLAVALIYIPYNYSAFGDYVYIATALNHFTEKRRTFAWLLAALSGVIALQALAFHFPFWEMLSAIGACTVGAVSTYSYCMSRKADARLRMAHDEIEQLAKTAERERIARDLHDVLGHTLSLISIKSELAARLMATDPERTARELADIQVTARRALAEVRQTVSGYKAQGLAAEIEQAVGALEAAGVSVQQRPERVPRLPAQQEASLTLLLREAVTNIVRHAQARTCAITLELEPEMLVLAIQDDGRGMQGNEGNGLAGMRERISDLGGTLQITSCGGVRLRFAVPLATLAGLIDPGADRAISAQTLSAAFEGAV